MQQPFAFISKHCFNMKYSGRFTLHASCEPWQHDIFFSAKGHKIVEILALLTTKLSSYKICKVGMLFCVLWALT